MRYNEVRNPPRESTGRLGILEGVILIPGRVQSRLGSPQFERWRSGAVLSIADQVGAEDSLPLREFCELWLDFYFPLEVEQPDPNILAENHIPRVTAAAEPVLIVLAGHLFKRRGQVRRLHLDRIVRPGKALEAEYGEAWRNGGVRVQYRGLP